MPKVGMKEFSYGPKGMKAAKMEAKKTGKKILALDLETLEFREPIQPDFPELKARFGVEGFPTMILLDPSGTELRRLSGYVNVADMTAFMEGTQ